MLILVASISNSFAIQFRTIGEQNERTGFVSMLMYIGLIYAFFGDLFIFNQTFSGYEMLGTGIVFFFTVGMLIYTNFVVQKKVLVVKSDDDDGFEMTKWINTL